MAQGTSTRAKKYGHQFLAEEEPQLPDRQMKRLPLMRSLLTLLVGIVVLSTATAQTASDPNEGLRLTYDSVLGSYDFSWWGQPGRTYFIQHSDDLLAWEYLPLIETGTDALRAWGFTSTANTFFLRLRTTDIPTSDPFNADFDGDKVGNYDEILFGTDPLVSLDSDLEELPDDWEKWHFGNLASGASDDPDNDGLSNLEEFVHSTNPKSPDSDFDGLSDGSEVNIHGTDPLKWDSDGDTLPDGWEVHYGLDPLDPADANQTSAGGGMTNLQHYELGSNPNNPPPPPTITAGTATLDQNAATLLYPADDSQLLLKNGNFSATALGSNDWNTFLGITGWTAISGDLIELQKFSSLAIDGQYCELDSHWPTSDHSGDSDHGIQQTVNLPRGHYLLFFDYRGRQHDVEAGSFAVKVKSAGSSSDVVLVTKNSASTSTWNRASTTFAVTGGDPNSNTLPITLLFDSSDARDSYGAYIDNVFLLPLDIQVKRPQNLSGDWAKSGKVIDNLLCVWDTHANGKDWVQVKVVLPDSIAQNLPAGFINWTVEGVATPIADNALETPKLRWPGGFGVKKITIDFPMARLRKFLYVDLPYVGHLSWDEVVSGFRSQGVAGYLRLAKILGYSNIATNWSESQTSLKPSERNALKHAAWMSLCASDVGLGTGYAKLAGDGYEFRDKDTNQPASESTMDLHNNEVGRGVIHTDGEGTAERHLIFAELLQKLEAGELWIWDGNDSEHGPDSLDLIIKSNEQKLYISEESY
jgi:Bacterial TSP3 repeat